jgi:CheY-like chemotaxis protein
MIPRKGTGLGLPMVLGVAEQSGGTFVLKSVQGSGTTAEIWLPASAAPTEPKDTAPELPHVKLPPMTVLVVDDDPLVLNNTVAMLEELGHTVLPAASGEDALSIFELGQPISLLITDHAMPHMTGTELASILQTRAPNLFIIIATGYAELPANLAKGFVKLAKPFNEAQLVNVIGSIFDRTRTSGKVVPFAKS